MQQNASDGNRGVCRLGGGLGPLRQSCVCVLPQRPLPARNTRLVPVLGTAHLSKHIGTCRGGRVGTAEEGIGLCRHFGTPRRDQRDTRGLLAALGLGKSQFPLPEGCRRAHGSVICLLFPRPPLPFPCPFASKTLRVLQAAAAAGTARAVSARPRPSQRAGSPALCAGGALRAGQGAAGRDGAAALVSVSVVRGPPGEQM